MWNEVEPGISGRFRLKLGYPVSLRSFYFPTNDMLEETPTEVCPFAHTFVFCLRKPGRVADQMARITKTIPLKMSRDPGHGHRRARDSWRERSVDPATP